MAEIPVINTSPLIFLTKGGLVIIAKQCGKIKAARPVLEQLCLSGMYLSNHVINQALELVGK